ncbi:hypothetical protein K461DRAFT_279824 [Myriangium duriaei CBS 260.36]|uniref:Uncharacterized protein n=1 Tax=Myriangium duriaei CBS 260.36 TaxID=1168546 RepID=A0A9P4J074_9PEZI|nr:hypothetical protein K461DRAFT_279824 [Myriangium duriaei CBS 260.36]
MAGKDFDTSGAIEPTAAVSPAALRSTPAQSASRSRIPGFVRFPIAVVLALGISAGLYSAAAELTGFELSTVSRSLDEPWQILALVGWRIAELFTYWASGFDYWDVGHLTLLTLTPYHSLLSLFYSISPISVLTSVVIDLLSSVLPFALLRPQAPYNDPPSSAPASTQLSTSITIRFMVTFFLTVTYAVTIFACLQSFLPSYIVSQFDIRTLEPVRSATFLILLAALLPIGNAAKSFLYVPSTYLARASLEEKDFDPKTATFGETIAYNLGLSGWGKREDVLVRRTLLLAALTLGASIAKIFGTVEGAELTGAIGWGGVWAATSLLAGAGLGYVGDA